MLGNKLWKKTEDTSVTGKTISTTAKYIEGFVNESKGIEPADTANPDYSDKFQFMGHEEGRIRGLYNHATNPMPLLVLYTITLLKITWVIPGWCSLPKPNKSIPLTNPVIAV